MNVMAEAQELIETPLSREELAVRYRDLCSDPTYNRVPGKIEIDPWGRLVMTPPSFYHGRVQGRVIHALGSLSGGEVAGEADVAWASDAFVRLHGNELAVETAPEVCVEVVSPSNSGAQEVWLVYLKSERYEIFGPQGQMEKSAFPVDLGGLFN